MKLKVNDIVKFKSLSIHDPVRNYRGIHKLMQELSNKYGKVIRISGDEFQIEYKPLNTLETNYLWFNMDMIDSIVGRWQKEYDIDDKVIIRGDLQTGECHNWINPDMVQDYKFSLLNITRKSNHDLNITIYKCSKNNWRWPHDAIIGKITNKVNKVNNSLNKNLLNIGARLRA